MILGAILGILVSTTSVGAGALGITALLVLYHKLPIARIAGSDIAHAVPLTLIAGIGHWVIGAVDFGLMYSLLAGSIPDQRRQPARQPRTRRIPAPCPCWSRCCWWHPPAPLGRVVIIVKND